MEDLLLRHDSHGRLSRPAAPRRLHVAAVALRSRPSSSLAVPGFPPATAPAPAPALEHVLPSPPVAADAATVLLEVGVPQEDLRRAAGMCPELMSVPVETITAALRFLTDEAGVPAEELPRVLRRRPRLLVSPVAARLRPTLYFLRALSPCSGATPARRPCLPCFRMGAGGSSRATIAVEDQLAVIQMWLSYGRREGGCGRREAVDVPVAELLDAVFAPSSSTEAVAIPVAELLRIQYSFVDIRSGMAFSIANFMHISEFIG